LNDNQGVCEKGGRRKQDTKEIHSNKSIHVHLGNGLGMARIG